MKKSNTHLTSALPESLTSIVGKGVAWVTASNLILKSVGLVTMVLVLRNLSVFEYGVAELVQTVLPIMSIFLLPGLSAVITADLGIERQKGNLGKMKGMLLAYAKTSAVLGVFAWAILFFGSSMIANLYSADIGKYFMIISVLLLVAPVRTLITVFFSVLLQFRDLYLIGIVEEISKFLLLVCFATFSILNITEFLWAIVLSQVLSVVVFLPRFWVLYSRFFHTISADKVHPLSLFYEHGKWGIAANYLSGFGQSVRLWIIKFFVGTEAVGLFAVAIGLLGHTRSLLPIGNIVAPIIPQYVSDQPRFFRIVHRSIKYLAAGYALIAVVGFFLFPPILAYIFPEYVPSFPLFEIMLLTLIPTAFGNVFNQMFFALQGQKNLFFSMIYRIILSCLLLPPLLYFFGITGAAIEFVIITTLFAFERYRVLRRMLPAFAITFGSLITISQEDRALFHDILLRGKRLFAR